MIPPRIAKDGKEWAELIISAWKRVGGRYPADTDPSCWLEDGSPKNAGVMVEFTIGWFRGTADALRTRPIRVWEAVIERNRLSVPQRAAKVAPAKVAPAKVAPAKRAAKAAPAKPQRAAEAAPAKPQRLLKTSRLSSGWPCRPSPSAPAKAAPAKPQRAAKAAPAKPQRAAKAAPAKPQRAPAKLLRLLAELGELATAMSGR